LSGKRKGGGERDSEVTLEDHNGRKALLQRFKGSKSGQKKVEEGRSTLLVSNPGGGGDCSHPAFEIETNASGGETSSWGGRNRGERGLPCFPSSKLSQKRVALLVEKEAIKGRGGVVRPPCVKFEVKWGGGVSSPPPGVKG